MSLNSAGGMLEKGVALESITSDTPPREGGSLFGRLNLSSENLNQNAGLGHFTSVELAPFAKP
jgi:hypothetical protein